MGRRKARTEVFLNLPYDPKSESLFLYICAAHLRVVSGTIVGEMAYTRERLYTRYPFSAAGEIVDGSGAGMPSAVTNISYGGCRLLTQRQLPLGAAIIVKIQRGTEQFEAAANVVHSTPSEAGVMFGDIAARSLFVLGKWIEAASEEKRRLEGR